MQSPLVAGGTPTYIDIAVDTAHDVAKLDLVHRMLVSVALVALDTEVKVVASAAVVTGLDQVPFAVVARVQEPVVVRVVQLVQHCQTGKFGSPQAGKFVMLFACQSEKGVTPVHEIT